MDTRQRSTRILMFPWLAHGHISPFLELAKALTTRNFHIHVCSTPINLSSIEKNLTEKDSISIKLVELHIPALAELPPHYHTTNGLPPHLMPTLKLALDTARPRFSTILQTLRPDLVLYDFLHPWVPEEATLQNIPAVLFLTPGAASCSYILHGWLDPGSEFPFPAMYLRDYEHIKYSRMTQNETNDNQRVLECIQRSSDIILIKTFRELEEKYIDHLCIMNQKKFVPVGSLIQRAQYGSSDDPSDVINWLDMKEPGSTVFASFGSEFFLSKVEIEEIAYGLELSRVNFIWVIRFHGEENAEIEDTLPDGFLERVGERGKVVEGWAPQGRILAHPSVGGFVSHCGWSSVMEGIYYGVPIVAVPMHLDQPLNSRLVVDVGFGEEVVRNREGKLEAEEVARVVRKVVLEKEGEILRRKVREMSEKMRGKGEEEIDEAAEEMVKLCRKKEMSRLSPANSMEKLRLMMLKRESVSSDV